MSANEDFTEDCSAKTGGCTRTGHYATASRRRILEFLQKNCDRTVTVSDIAIHLKETGNEVNLTTIYRYLDKLSGEGSVIKYASEKGSQAAYQYVEQGKQCDRHLHLQCVRCGCVIHLDCAFMNEISSHVQQDHGFTLQCRRSVLYGTCQKCTASENGSSPALDGEVF